MMVYKNNKGLLNIVSTVALWSMVATIAAMIILGLWMFVSGFFGFHIGDKVRMTGNAYPPGTVGTINGTYEYNNYHSTELHTGYRVLINGEDLAFDHTDFVHTFAK